MTFKRSFEAPAELRPLLERIRELCLSLPGTEETSSWGHPNFRAGKRTFVTFEEFEGATSVAFRLPAADIERHEKASGFHLTPYGRGAWLSLTLTPRSKWSQVKDLVLSSYATVAPRQPSSRSTRLRGQSERLRK